MLRSTERIRFEGHAGNALEGILELPSGNREGYIIFSHCFTCGKDLKAIVRISRELANLGFAVLRFDYSGLGQSQGEFAKTNFTTNRSDLRAAMQFLQRSSQQPLFLMGHSFGGAVSLSLAEESNVHGVIGLAAPSDTHHLADLLAQMDPNIERTGQGSVVIGGFRFSVERQMLNDLRSYNLLETVDRIEKPLLILHSSADETVPFWNAIRICGFENAPASGKNRSLINLWGANHLLTNRPSDCTYVAKLVNQWCRRVLETS